MKILSARSWVCGFAFSLALFTAIPDALACSAPPAELTVHHKELVSASKLIALARVVGTIDEAADIKSDTSSLLGTHKGPKAYFETIEVLRGDVPARFALRGGRLVNKKYNPDGDFNGHRNLVFWDKGITGNWNGSDCRMYPTFVPGRTYLIFLDRPHWRAYEEVRGPNDLWLLAVRHLIDDPSLSSGLTMTVFEWLSHTYGVFVGRIVSCDGPTLSVDEALSGKFGPIWRYSKNSHVQYWPGKCVVNRQFLVAAYREQPEILPYYSASVFQVQDGRIDLSIAIDRSEVEIKGQAVQTLHDLRNRIDIKRSKH